MKNAAILLVIVSLAIVLFLFAPLWAALLVLIIGIACLFISSRIDAKCEGESEDKIMEKNKSKLMVYALGGITVAVILIISIFWGISSKSDAEPSPKPSVAPTPPRATREVSAQNTPAASESDLLDFEIKEVSGTQMALAVAEKTKVQGFTEAEFSALCDDTVKPLMDGGCGWVTIDFGDGTGIVFTGGLAHYPTYGEIDSTGSLLKSIGDITCKDGSVTYQAK